MAPARPQIIDDEEPLVLRQAALSRVRPLDFGDDDLFEPVRAAGGAR